MKQTALLCSVMAILAASMPVKAQVATLNCSFKNYQDGKFLSSGTAQFTIDYGHRTVDGRAASFLSDRIVWDVLDASGNSTTTYYRKDGGYHSLNRTPGNVLLERYGTCK